MLLLSACNGSKEKKVFHQKLSRYCGFEDTIYNSGRRVLTKIYYPFEAPILDERHLPLEIRTYEFSDSAIAITRGIPHCPVKITLNTPDSFYIFSLEKAYDTPINLLENNLSKS